MVKQVLVEQFKYECEVCGHRYDREGDAECCEGQVNHKATALYGDDWDVGDTALLFFMDNEGEHVIQHHISRVFQLGHRYYPFPPDMKQWPQFQFVATYKECDR